MGEIAKKRIGALANPRCILAIVGLAFYWPLFRRPFVGTLFSERTFDLYSAQFCYFLAMFGVGVIMGILPAAFERILRATGPVPAAISAAMAGSGAALLLLVPGGSSLSSLLMILGFILLIAGLSGISLRWVSACIRLGDRAPLCLALSYLASFAIGFVEAASLPLPWVCIVLPVASALVGVAAMRSPAEPPPFAASADSPALTQFAPARPIDPRFLTGILVILVVALMGACCETAAWRANALGYSTPSYAAYSYILSALVAMILVAIALTARDSASLWVRGSLFLVAVLLISIGLRSLTDGRLGVPLLVASQTSARFFLWALLIARPRPAGKPSSADLGLFFCIDSAASLVTLFIVPTLAGVTQETAGTLALPLALGGTLVLAGTMVALAALALLKGTAAPSRMAAGGSVAAAGSVPVATASGAFEPPSLPAEAAASAATAPPAASASALPIPSAPAEAPLSPQLLEDRFGLTAREAEVAQCLAQGHSVKRTAQLLFLAPSTVQSYSKTIYRKLGIHSKQELIDLLR